MAYIIKASNKDYIVSPHAAARMLQRGISEELVILTLENGTITVQSHGTYLFEYSLYDDAWEEMITIQVVVDENNQIIVTVVDQTQED
jgi:hypothetical protein